MKEVLAENLVIGKEYYDINSIRYGCKMKLINMDESTLYFKSISNQSLYIENGDGLIMFSKIEPFYTDEL